MVWPGGAGPATPIINWILANGGTARYREDGSLLADPNCPSKDYHETHHYCPTCAWNSGQETLSIDTLEGVITASPGDVMIRGVQGEFYPCKPDIFKKTYEDVTA
jgi:hypothetical protein